MAITFRLHRKGHEFNPRSEYDSFCCVAPESYVLLPTAIGLTVKTHLRSATDLDTYLVVEPVPSLPLLPQLY